jgi:putative transcription factor
LRCEVCGRKINGKPITAIIEGAKLTVCVECSKHGEICREEPKPKLILQRLRATPAQPRMQMSKPQAPSVDTSQELVENYHAKIRQAREKLGLSHEDLGKRINEKVSLLRKIETKKMRPDNALAIKLEHTLKTKLIVPASEEKTSAHGTRLIRATSRELTLGDLVQLGKKEKKGKEDSTERKQS